MARPGARWHGIGETPTALAMIVGRVQINGIADAPAVHALQDQFSLTPLDADPGPARVFRNRTRELGKI